MTAKVPFDSERYDKLDFGADPYTS